MSENNILELPVLVIREALIFPDNSLPVSVGRSVSVKAIEQSRSTYDSLVFVTNQLDPKLEQLTVEDVFDYGTLCRITTIKEKGSSFSAVIKAKSRVKLISLRLQDGCFFAHGEILANDPIDPDTETNYYNEIRSQAVKTQLKEVVEKYENVAKNRKNFYDLAYRIFQASPTMPDVLKSAMKASRAEEILALANMAINSLVLNNKIDNDINATIRNSSEQAQRDYFLRERLKAIKKEIANNDPATNDSNSVEDRLAKGQYPENVKAKVLAELQKANMMPPGSLEVSLIQNYIETILAVPWWQKSEDNDSLNNVEKILDEDHFGLDKPKERILEYLAVKKLTGNLKAPILCFYGPPGCGKTSLGRSIARALGRKFVKASLGGVSDEAEIRGHRRTYVGSMPGRIVSGMKKVGVVNPVFLLDEVDKLGSSYKGDPANALLEVLDPEQNFAFNDNYLEEPYDLSHVLFLCTANYLEDIPAPLRDRLELIEVNSYTALEKLEIAKRHLIKKECLANGIKEGKVTFDDDAILYIIEHYTREAGVRELERKIATCLRKAAVIFVKNPRSKPINIDIDKVKEFLGTQPFENTKKEKDPQIGVVTGLAYTQFGGDILPIEVTHFKGKGGLVLTGKLGDVMKESATIALDYVRANADKYNIPSELFLTDDIHIHVPEGAVPKDGPSAGVAITTAIISCLSKTPVNPNVAMTGEVTLRGHALAIGGLREKSLAALRAGIKTIIVPRENTKSIEELPKEVKDSLEIIFMDNVDDALKVALMKND